MTNEDQVRLSALELDVLREATSMALPVGERAGMGLRMSYVFPEEDQPKVSAATVTLRKLGLLTYVGGGYPEHTRKGETVPAMEAHPDYPRVGSGYFRTEKGDAVVEEYRDKTREGLRQQRVLNLVNELVEVLR